MKLSRALAVLMACGAATAAATETEFWVVDTAEELLEGRGDGVAVHDEGRLERVAVWRRGVVFEEPLLIAGGRTEDGALVVGTGHPARLYRVLEGRAERLTEVPGEQVTAVLVTPDGAILAGSVLPGALHRWRDGELEEVARLGDEGIWDLAVFDGQVVVAAGTPATLYRLGARGLERWVELPDAHARCLYPTADQLLVGTSGKGLILGVDASGRMALLADSPFTEISDLVATSDGSVWATVLVGEPVAKKSSSDKAASEPSVTTEAGTDLDLPKINGTTASSELLRLTPEGALVSVHRFGKQVASAVAWDGSGILVGTGYEGEVWRFVDSGGTRLATVDAVQVVALADEGSALLTQGPGQVLWRGTEEGSTARYRIDAREFPRPVRLGEYRITPADAEVRIRFRSGVSAKPDDTWLPWSEFLDSEKGTVGLPPSKAVQWEIELDPGASVERVELAYREVNLAPRVEELTVDDPGVVYLTAPPPSGPVIERDNPDVSGIFTVFDERGGDDATGSSNARGKKYWRVGFRTVSWKVEDPNGDPLRFALALEREDGFRLDVRERVDGTQLAVDMTAVPDGTYRFRLTASDELKNPADARLATASSGWFAVDNTAPEIAIRRDGGSWQVEVTDERSPVTQVEWSRDGDEWRTLAPIDGLLDGTSESFVIPAEDGRHLVVVRAIDRHHNRATQGVVEGSSR